MTEGLRERKKAQTRDALIDAAYAVAREHGAEAVTAEAVTDLAGVSRRTFFNYFPSVDAALEAGLVDFFGEFEQILAERPLHEPVLDSLVAIADLEPTPALLQRVATVAALGHRDPRARALTASAQQEFTLWLIQHLAERAPAGTDPTRLVHLATAFIASAQASIWLWASQHDGPVTADSTAALQEGLLRGIQYVRAGFEHPEKKS